MKVSVIVPVYNTSEFVKKCLSSILNQKFNDFELIIINDGSQDDSEKKIQEIINGNDKCVYIYQNNKGLSEARNRGLDVAKGKYIVFVDSDDWIDNDFLEIMVKSIEHYNADICMCGYTRRTEKEVFKNFIPKFKLNNINDKNTLLNFYYNTFIQEKYGIICCNKIYKKSLIVSNNIRFKKNEEIYAEDVLFNSELVSVCNRIVELPNSLYNYRIREVSITTSYKVNLEKRYSNLLKNMEINLSNRLDNDLELISLMQYEAINVISINSYSINNKFIDIYKSLMLYKCYNHNLFDSLKGLVKVKKKLKNISKERKYFISLFILIINFKNTFMLSLLIWSKVKIKNKNSCF